MLVAVQMRHPDSMLQDTFDLSGPLRLDIGFADFSGQPTGGDGSGAGWKTAVRTDQGGIGSQQGSLGDKGQMHTHVQGRGGAQHLHRMLEGAADGHEGGRRDDPLAMGLQDPFIDALGYAEIVGVHDQTDGRPLSGSIAGDGVGPKVSHAATGGVRESL